MLEKPGGDWVSVAADGRGLEHKTSEDEHSVSALRRRAEAQQPGASLHLPGVISQCKAEPKEAVSPSLPAWVHTRQHSSRLPVVKVPSSGTKRLIPQWQSIEEKGMFF